jgi:tetratricopeptide (TPR) repeat protein
MSEESAMPEEASYSGGVAMDIALDEARNDPELRGTVETYLKRQIKLADIQEHHLREQFKHLHLSVWEKQLGVLLRVATAVVGIAVAVGFALMVWDAAHSNGLIIEPFAVPTDMAAKGLTGQTIASKILDKLYAMESVAGTNRSKQSYVNNWGTGIKVEIPETGVSISEFRQFLRDWLGHDTHISGEIYHTDAGIVITARTGGEGGGSFTGLQTELDQLIQKAAEYVYGQTQPARYAAFLQNNNRMAEGLAILRRLTDDPSHLERAWAWGGQHNPSRFKRDYGGALWYLYKATSVYPDFVQGYHLAAWYERLLSHPEKALENYRKTKELFDQGAGSQIDPRHAPKLRLDTDLYVAFLLGDFARAGALGQTGADIANSNGSEVTFDTLQNAVAVSLGLQHDGIHARAFFGEMPELEESRRNRGSILFLRELARVRMDAALEDWPDVAAAEASAEKIAPFICPACEWAKVFRVELRPWLALAKARTGDIAGAETLIASSPGDCTDCVRIRGVIASEVRQYGRADYWFARAIHLAPSIPFAYADWGQSLLARGDADRAIAKFIIANQKGPHFADALEGWGEALMAKNQSHLALEKFAEAEKYAPNWGRLHLKWGEALAYSGNKDEAQKQFARAAALDLTPSEKFELASMPHV